MIHREVRRQIVVHERVAKLRLYYYYNLRGRVNFLWAQLHDAILEEVESGGLLRYEAAKGWLHEPGADPEEVQRIYERRVPVYEAWSQHGGGLHLERLVRRAFSASGYTVADRRMTLTWHNPGSGDEEKHELDVFTLHPIRVGIECKNKLSDVYVSPDILRHPNDDHAQIKRHFAICAANEIIPVLVAPLIDSSFFGFQQAYGGLACRLLFQYLPPDQAGLCEQVRREFRIGHVKTAVEDSPPIDLMNWVGRLKEMLGSID